MRIAVVGAGKVGGTLGGKWESDGHEVVYGLRDPSKKERARPIKEALHGADAVLLAIPAQAIVDFVRQHSADLDGKLVIDATNNFRAEVVNFWPEITAAIPSAKLYRAFNTLGLDVFANPTIGGVQADMFYVGPEGSTRQAVEGLISDVGLRPVRLGGPDQVNVVDGFLRIWATLSQKHGRHIAFKLLTD